MKFNIFHFPTEDLRTKLEIVSEFFPEWNDDKTHMFDTVMTLWGNFCSAMFVSYPSRTGRINASK
jgi:hypothetical protein